MGLFIYCFIPNSLYSDIAIGQPKKTPKKKSFNIIVEVDKTAKSSRLAVPAAANVYLQENNIDGKIEITELDQEALNDQELGNEEGKSSLFSRKQIIVGSTFLTLSFVFGGLMFVRRYHGKLNNRWLILLLIFSFTGTSILFADLAPPPPFRPKNNADLTTVFKGKIDVERSVVDRQTIKLILTPEDYSKLKKTELPK